MLVPVQDLYLDLCLYHTYWMFCLCSCLHLTQILATRTHACPLVYCLCICLTMLPLDPIRPHALYPSVALNRMPVSVQDLFLLFTTFLFGWNTRCLYRFRTCTWICAYTSFWMLCSCLPVPVDARIGSMSTPTRRVYRVFQCIFLYMVSCVLTDATMRTRVEIDSRQDST